MPPPVIRYQKMVESKSTASNLKLYRFYSTDFSVCICLKCIASPSSNPIPIAIAIEELVLIYKYAVLDIFDVILRSYI